MVQHATKWSNTLQQDYEYKTEQVKHPGHPAEHPSFLTKLHAQMTVANVS